MNNELLYTTQLQAGCGVVDETRILLGLWTPGMNAQGLLRAALKSGQFPNVTARSLRNLVVECFARRFLVGEPLPAIMLKAVQPTLSGREFVQLLFLFCCRANRVLADFVRSEYWSRYGSGNLELTQEHAQAFVLNANQDGKTTVRWSESTVVRVARYMIRSCTDFGLLGSHPKNRRPILNFRIEPTVAVILAYQLHFSGLGDNAVIAHSDWELFGLDRDDVREELKLLSRQGHWVMQSAGDVTRLSWKYKNWEEFLDVLAQS